MAPKENSKEPEADKKEQKKNEIEKQWLEMFCEKKGLSHLFYSLVSLPITAINNPLTRKCFALLLKMLNIIRASGYQFKTHVGDYEAMREKVAERVLLVLEAFAQHSILPESVKIMKTPKKIKPTEVETKKTQDEAQKAAIVEPQLSHKERKQQEEESKAFEYGFALIKGAGADQYNYFDIIMKFEYFKEFLLKGLILSDNPLLQNSFAEELANIYKSFKTVAYSSAHAHVVLIPYMLKNMVDETLERETNCKRFYKLICDLAKDLQKSDMLKLNINFHEYLNSLAENIKNHNVKENKSTETDIVIIGLLNLLEALLGKFPEEKEFIGQDCGFVNEILHRCLFDFPKIGSRKKVVETLPPKCKSEAARQAAFNLLNKLASDCPKNMKQIIDYLAPIHA